MTTQPHKIHEGHSHTHGSQCGHKAVRHDGHTDYLHDGHLHTTHEGHIDEHTFEKTAQNPDKCTPDHKCADHDSSHKHGPNCGHESFPHAGHSDYLVGDHLHHLHNGHCDDHGKVSWT